MPKEYPIFYNNSVFKVRRADRENDCSETRYGSISVESASCYVECLIRCPQPFIRIGNFNVSKVIKGRIWHKNNFGEVWDLMVEIIKKDNSVEKIIFQGGEFTHSFTAFSIAYSIINFFNEIHRFETVEDYKDYLITKTDNQANRPLEDEILNIGRIISLCRKYEELNPVFPYRDKLRKWIEARINRLISTSK